MGSCQSFDGKADAKQKGRPQILVKSFTWSRDSHGLFDYESKNLSKGTLKNQNSGVLVRKQNDVLFARDASDPYSDPEAKELVNLTVREGNYWVYSIASSKNKKPEKGSEEEYNNNEQSVWMVVKSFKSATNNNKPGFKLTEGDLIKLGRIKFRVKEFRGSKQAVEEKKSIPDKNQRSITPEKQVKTFEELPEGDKTERRDSKSSIPGSNKSLTTQTCRICLGEEADAEDPFFCPCNCSGTMKYIHVLCLQKWLKGKIHNKQTNHSTSIYWKTLECELCKVTYPSSFTVNGKKYDIVEITRPDCAYVMLEILSKEKNILRGLHIIKMDEKDTVKLGRGHDSDIRITDISVSRCHALIKLHKGNYYLEDNNSKFGTLVHLKKPFPLAGDYNNISLQIGRSVISLSVKKNWKAVSNCFGGNAVRDPTEVNDDELSPINQSQNNDSNQGINRARTDIIEVPANVGAFDLNSNRDNEVRSQNNPEEDAEQSVSDIPNDEDLPNNDEEELQENQGNGEEEDRAPHNENQQPIIQGTQQNQQRGPEDDVVVENMVN